MPKLKIATWNINSVRLRINRVLEFLETEQPDVLCLQETKVHNDSFPSKPFVQAGYPHLAINGQKAYHGVATIARVPIETLEAREFCAMGDTRHIAVSLPGGGELHNFYVPAGGDEADPGKNPKFRHKLDFLTEMEEWMKGWADHGTAKRVMVGDLNIAPGEHDVWSHKQLLKVVSHTPVEIEHLARVEAAGQWHDPIRAAVPDDEKLYTWWSYRARDWRASNRGRRLDHIWVSPALQKTVQKTAILESYRDGEKPSDHCPVVATITV